MCNPLAWQITAAFAAAHYSKAQADVQIDYQAKVADNAVKASEFAAADAVKRGELETKQAQLKIKDLKGQQTAAIAGSGFTIEPDSSGAAVLEDTAALGTEDIFAIKSNAAREAWQVREKGKQAQTDFGLIATQARNETRGAILSSAGAVASKWYAYKKRA